MDYGCVSNVIFHIHLNGRIHGSFKGSRGLGHGDPLSSLLFVLAMEYFSRIIQRVSTHRDFQYHPHCKKLNLTHLMFVDDLVLFYKADGPTIHITKSALTLFSRCARLEANLQKSQLVLGGCSQELHTQCLQATNYQDSHFPMKYLGVPITASGLTKVECSSLLEKITARVHIWATRNLSFAGRAMLINE